MQFNQLPALDGLQVLDFSHALSGPYCTMLFALYGATVYKVEPLGGDMGRGWGSPESDSHWGPCSTHEAR